MKKSTGEFNKSLVYVDAPTSLYQVLALGPGQAEGIEGLPPKHFDTKIHITVQVINTTNKKALSTYKTTFKKYIDNTGKVDFSFLK